MNKKVDFGVKVLKDLLEKIKEMPVDELTLIVKESDEKFKTIQQNRKLCQMSINEEMESSPV